MTRKEIYQEIKAKGLVEQANARAKKVCSWAPNANYTNLSNIELLGILATVKTKEASKKTCEKKPAQKCVDEGARKAILAIGKVLNIKGLEKNFE